MSSGISQSWYCIGVHIFLDRKFRMAHFLLMTERGGAQDPCFWHRSYICFTHCVKLLTLGHLRSDHPVKSSEPTPTKSLLSHRDLAWCELVSKFSRTMRNICPKSYAKKGGPTHRPFPAINKKVSLSYGICCPKNYMLLRASDGQHTLCIVLPPKTEAVYSI